MRVFIPYSLECGAARTALPVGPAFPLKVFSCSTRGEPGKWPAPPTMWRGWRCGTVGEGEKPQVRHARFRGVGLPRSTEETCEQSWGAGR